MVDATTAFREHRDGTPKAMPIPKGTEVRAEERNGNMRVTCALSLEALQVYMRDAATVFRAGALEVPVFFAVHHKNGVRIRIERNAGGPEGRALADALMGVASGVRGDAAEAHVTAFEFSLACGCGVRVDVVAPWAKGGAP